VHVCTSALGNTVDHSSNFFFALIVFSKIQAQSHCSVQRGGR
jgi:hypothetical protein